MKSEQVAFIGCRCSCEDAPRHRHRVSSRPRHPSPIRTAAPRPATMRRCDIAPAAAGATDRLATIDPFAELAEAGALGVNIAHTHNPHEQIALVGMQPLGPTSAR